MPAYAEEIEQALIEGVKLKTLVQPVEVQKDRNGEVSGIVCSCMRLGEFDRSGRRRPKPDQEEETFVLETDQIIVAIGQRLNSDVISGDLDIHIGRHRFIDTDPITSQTSIEWIFAGGDAATGPVSVVAAIGSGENAAVGIDEYLTGENHAFWREEKVVDTAFDPDADPVPYTRDSLPVIEPDRRKNNFDEVERTWPEGVALRQCARCLRCDYGK
jgi:NADH-quinone oxidoreductase subunit F